VENGLKNEVICIEADSSIAFEYIQDCDHQILDCER